VRLQLAVHHQPRDAPVAISEGVHLAHEAKPMRSVSWTSSGATK
jgi:hypothetical protein